MNALFLPAPTAAPEWEVSEWLNIPQGPRLADLRGRVVVLHAFQMLCPGCILHGVPQASRLYQFFNEKDVAVIGLHTVFEHHASMQPAALKVFLHEFRVRFPVGVDAAGGDHPVPRTMARYAMRGTPSLLLIDREGRLRSQTTGQVDDLSVGAAIQHLIDETYPLPN